MKVRRVAWMPFHLPFVSPFATAHETVAVREGLVLRLATDGLTGLGEASPVAAFGGGTLNDAIHLLRELGPRLVGLQLNDVDDLLARLDLSAPGAAAVACALDTAVVDLRARAAGLPAAALLGGDAQQPIAVNATIAESSAAAAARKAVEAGFRCVKLKVGLAGSCQVELDRIGQVRAAVGPATLLRLDANGAWSVDEAIAILREAERFELELVEQPVAADDLDGLARVRSAVATPIAADESVGRPDQARRVIAAGAADVLIVKPMLAGGLRPAHEIVELAVRAGLDALVTTTIDAGIGVAAALHLAATLPSPRRACGLATGRLLAGSLIEQPLAVQRGWMEPPSDPGLGVTLDQPQLERFGGAWEEAGAK